MARWREIKGYEGLYLVSDDGQIVALPRTYICGDKTMHRKEAKPMKKFLRGRDGLLYEGVALSRDGDTKRFSVHRLVAEAFVENPCCYDVVNHIDHDTRNNHYTNLEWCSQQYNNEYGHNKPVIQIYDDEVVAEYKSITHASKITKIGRTSINNVLRGWSTTAGGYRWEYKGRSEDLSH